MYPVGFIIRDVSVSVSVSVCSIANFNNLSTYGSILKCSYEIFFKLNSFTSLNIGIFE